MIQKIFLPTIFFLFLQSAEAQRIKFFSLTQVGVAMGSSGNGFQLQTVNGVRNKILALGAGISTDHYSMHSFPLFASLRTGFFDREQTPFMYVDLGSNLWGKTEKTNMIYDSWSSYHNGSYYDLGLGYSARIAKKLSLVMSFGYSQKKLAKTTEWQMGIDHSSDRYDYTMRSFSFKTGFSF
ncbi:MAG: hypothetical protein ACJ75B_07430 [Flavisolibacter sp.]